DLGDEVLEDHWGTGERTGHRPHIGEGTIEHGRHHRVEHWVEGLGALDGAFDEFDGGDVAAEDEFGLSDRIEISELDGQGGHRMTDWLRCAKCTSPRTSTRGSGSPTWAMVPRNSGLTTKASWVA